MEEPQCRRAGCPGGARHSKLARASLHVSFAKEARLNGRPKRATCADSALASHAPLGGRALALALARARDEPTRRLAAGRLGRRPLGDMRVAPLHKRSCHESVACASVLHPRGAYAASAECAQDAPQDALMGRPFSLASFASEKRREPAQSVARN
ncbi:hypothetical protein T492DRAFT_1134149 [Pavlovales sp. CCMP2436]|nr:hypothetical protein T492DRAFT_1134149 [Pavlovales sp. CCMP2436]